MSTLTGFTRPIQGDTDGNPIIAEDMRIHVATATGLTITSVEIHPTSVDVTGTINAGNSSALQIAINGYLYGQDGTNPFIPLANMSDVIPMLDNVNKVVTSHAALTADQAVLAVANSKTAVRFFDQGVPQNGTPNPGDVIVWIDNQTTSGGNITFYITSDRTSTGIPWCSSISANSVDVSTTDSTGTYSRGAASVTSNKTVVVPVTKRTDSLVTILGISVIAGQSMNTSPDGITAKLFAVGTAV